MGWANIVCVLVSLVSGSSAVEGIQSTDSNVVFVGPGVGTDGYYVILSLPGLARVNKFIQSSNHPAGRRITGYVAEVINEQVMLCGLYLERRGSKECTTLAEGPAWIPGPSMIKERAYAAATKTEDGWWVTGGSDDASTEILVNGKWENGPELPTALYGHCLLKLNSEQYLLTGGVTENSPPSFPASPSYLLQNGVYSEIVGGPTLMTQACAMLGEDAYVVGGVNTLTKEATSDVLVWSEGKWKAGPELPVPIFGSSLIVYEGHLYLLGGMTGKPMDSRDHHYNRIIYKLENGDWTAVSDAGPQIWAFSALVVPSQIIG